MISAAVYSGRLKVDTMFRQEASAEVPFSGWVFFSSEEGQISSEERGLALHDCRAILRFAPEVEGYLDRPHGTELVRSGTETFDVDRSG